jgi:hypothetical protein
MNNHKKDQDLAVMSTRRLLARRRSLAAGIGDVERVLAGSLVEQTRRCGKRECRCADGQPHGPYSYFSPRPHGRGRLKYVSPALTDVVGRYLHRHGEIDAALAEISAINAELLARRELT